MSFFNSYEVREQESGDLLVVADGVEFVVDTYRGVKRNRRAASHREANMVRSLPEVKEWLYLAGRRVVRRRK